MIPEGARIRELTERKGLRYFLRRFWTIADPKVPGFREGYGWFADAICDGLEACVARAIRNLVLNAPPGTGKSMIVSVMLPIWTWTLDPKHPIMITAYADNILGGWALARQNILVSREFQSAWPEIKLAGRAARPQRNNQGGIIHSIPLAGGSMGKHARIQILDDPHKVDDSPDVRAKAVAAWLDTFATRAGPGAELVRIVNQQRIAEDDVSAACLRTGDYEHLMIPWRYHPNPSWRKAYSLPIRDPRTAPGQTISGDPEDEDKDRRIRPQIRAAQYDQNPTPDAGGVIEKAWLQRWTWEMLGDLDNLRWFQSWDFGFKGNDTAQSRVVGGLFAANERRCFLVDLTKPEHLNYSQSKARLREVQTLDLWKRAYLKLIEDKANGPAIMSDLAEEIVGMYPVEPKGTKAERLARHSDAVKGGALWLPPASVCPYADDAENELVGFPNAAYDDIVDITSQALDNVFHPHANRLRDLQNLAAKWDNRDDVDE